MSRLLALLILLSPATAFAWGATGHELVSGVGAEILPDEIPAFVRTQEAIGDITILGRELDRSKGTGNPHDAERDPGHYVILDDSQRAGGTVTLDMLPPTREAYDTILRTNNFTQYRIGYLPYSIVDGWQQLAKDFAYWRAASIGARTAVDPADRAWFDTDRKRREALVIRDLGVWSHYVGDASQPMHVSIHFDGWGQYANPRGFTTKRGLHAQFEGAFVKANIKREAVKAATVPYRDCGKCTIWDRMRTLILASHAEVVPLYELEQKSGFTVGNPDTIAFVTSRLADSSSALRDMVVDAWRGSLDMTVGYPLIPMRDIESGKHILTRDDFGRD
jgi:hypothetical protein